ncbi:polyketide synthase [Niveomyces insectorum RCEF 264]|uniref:Polyketide synthase n=1 Tax=Niveomyces insectorum RCEF 264 TaxID=1081102 RepID=A0A167UK54_9HYPO|nr:polyketide synthase [Niveomyces insectorum RCEF 264]
MVAMAVEAAKQLADPRPHCRRLRNHRLRQGRARRRPGLPRRPASPTWSRGSSTSRSQAGGYGVFVPMHRNLCSEIAWREYPRLLMHVDHFLGLLALKQPAVSVLCHIQDGTSQTHNTSAALPPSLRTATAFNKVVLGNFASAHETPRFSRNNHNRNGAKRGRVHLVVADHVSPDDIHTLAVSLCEMNENALFSMGAAEYASLHRLLTNPEEVLWVTRDAQLASHHRPVDTRPRPAEYGGLGHQRCNRQRRRRFVYAAEDQLLVPRLMPLTQINRIVECRPAASESVVPGFFRVHNKPDEVCIAVAGTHLFANDILAAKTQNASTSSSTSAAAAPTTLGTDVQGYVIGADTVHAHVVVGLNYVHRATDRDNWRHSCPTAFAAAQNALDTKCGIDKGDCVLLYGALSAYSQAALQVTAQLGATAFVACPKPADKTSRLHQISYPGGPPVASHHRSRRHGKWTAVY